MLKDLLPTSWDGLQILACSLELKYNTVKKEKKTSLVLIMLFIDEFYIKTKYKFG